LVRDCAEQLGLEPEGFERSDGVSPALGLGRGGPFDRFRQMRIGLVIERYRMDR
jgi:hypothetical protein